MKMIDVGAKPKTERVALARGFIAMSRATVSRIRRGDVEKGDVLAAARLAGVMAAKKTPDLVPLCHPIALSASGARGDALDEAVRLVRSLGPEGVVLGSGAGDGAGDLLALPRAAGRLAKAGLSPAVIRRVCGGNARALLGVEAER